MPPLPPESAGLRAPLTTEEQRLVAEKERARSAPGPPPRSWEERARPYRRAATWSLFLGTGTLAAWNLWRTRAAGGRLERVPHQGLLAGATALLLSPALAWSVARLVGLPDSAVRTLGALTIGLLFPAGWLLAGVGARPQSAGRGLALAAGLYLAVGLVLPTATAALMGDGPTGSLLRPDAIVSLAVLAPMWPLHVSFLTGMFGLVPN